MSPTTFSKLVVIINPNRRRQRGKNSGRSFSALFLALDEGGRIVTFAMTPSKSLDDAKENLIELKQRGGAPGYVYSGKQSNNYICSPLNYSQK